MGPRFTELAQGLPSTVPFVGPEAQERALGRVFRARLGANESVFGPSPKAIVAMEREAAAAWKYADPESHDLKAALAAHHGVSAECLSVGEGIDGLLGNLVRLLVGTGDAVVTSLGAYPTFNYHVAGFGGSLHAVPYRDDRQDLLALIEKAAEVDAKLVYICNPDNPMGGWWSGDEVSAAIAKLPEGAVLCLDEAYADTASSDALPALDTTHPRVIRMRTFSKAYGLAGTRVGYAITHPDFAQAFNKVRNHFGMSRVSQVGALAALEDQAYLAETVERVAAARESIAQIASKRGLKALPSATNFVTVDMGEGEALAKAMVAALGHHGVFVRMPFVAPQNRCIRISAGTDADLAVLDEVFDAALSDARPAHSPAK
ncbi:MAG: pyridoxal phosphate-dependent aminotransferase [Pseudomonadota bacterium]